MIIDSHGLAAQVGRAVGSPQKITTSASTARSTVLKPRTIYELNSTVSNSYVFGGSGINATVNDTPIIAGISKFHLTDDTNIYCAVIGSAGSFFLTEIALD